MLLQPYAILVILSIAMLLFACSRWRHDIVAIIALASSVAIGAVPFHNVYSGLSNPAVITVAAVMIISESVKRSGVLSFFVRQLAFAGSHPMVHTSLLCFATALLSAFMNNVGALALMLPIAIESSIKQKRSPSLILLPIAISSALGGLLTMIGTPPNLLIASYRAKVLGKSFTMFDFAHVGLGVAMVGILFIVLVGYRLLPQRRSSNSAHSDIFRIQDYLIEVAIPEDSYWVDQSIEQIETKTDADFILIGLIRNGRKRLSIRKDQRLQANDILILEASPQDIEQILNQGKVQIVGDRQQNSNLLDKHEIANIEATIPTGSSVIGRSATSMRLRDRYGLNLLAISRQGKSFRERIHSVRLRAGDVVLMNGSSNLIEQSIAQLGLLPLITRNLTIGTQQHQWRPIIIFLIAILLAALQYIPVELAFGAAVLALVLTGSMPARLLYKGIDWSIIILLAALIPVGQAFQTSGGSAIFSHAILSLSQHLSPHIILLILFILTMTLSDVMNNAATAVVMAPIAVALAQGLHANVDPFLMTVAVSSSCSFLTPIGHQNNIIVMGPGGYKFKDYFKIGLPLECLITLTAVPMIIWLWPLG